MTIQEKYKSLLEEIRQYTHDDDTSSLMYLDPDGLTFNAERVKFNDDINDFGASMPKATGITNPYYRAIFNGEEMETRAYYKTIDESMQGVTIFGLNGVHDNTGRIKTWIGARNRYDLSVSSTNGYYEWLSFGVVDRGENLWYRAYVDSAFENNVNYFTDGKEKRSVKLHIDALYFPLLIIHNSDENMGMLREHVVDIMNHCATIEEIETYNPQYFEEFKHWCLNYDVSTSDDPTDKEELKKYYIQNQTYKTDSRKSYKEKYENEKNLEFYCSKITKIWGYISDTYPYNIILKCKAQGEALQSIKRVNNETHEIDVITTVKFNNDYSTPKFTYKTLISDGGATFYYGQLRTNIPIFKNKSLSDKYEDDEIGEDEALQKGNTDIVNPIGEQINNTANNENVYNTSGYEIYALSFSELKNVFRTLHDETATSWEQVLDGLKFYGSNPIDSVLNLYHLPFNPSVFGSFASQSHATFGAFTLNLDFSISSLINTGKLFSLFNEPISPLFNDFRDYTNIKYTLYLPYFGFVDLRTDEIMERSLSCKCAFDFATHNLKYYIYADGKLINQIETSVGNNVPITVNDNVAKQEQVLQGITQVVGGGLSTASLLGGAVGGELSSFGGVVSGASSLLDIGSNMLQGTKAIFDNAPRQIKGNVSNALGHNDISYPFLIVEVCPSVAPFNELQMFGKPTNAISTLNNFHGFTMVNDIRLNSIANKKHKEQIKTLLSSGVILP